jgi:uridine kinase
MTLSRTLDRIAAAVRDRALFARPRALLVALSGIDGSGKSALAKSLASAIEREGLRVATIGIDPWQQPQSVRFGGADCGKHFYRHAIRFEELFAQLVDPLVVRRSIHLRTRAIRTDSDIYDPLEYCFDDVDVVLLEGILLLQSRYDARYDLRAWIECSFETALRRALQRNVERLSEHRLREDYERIYHAAQRYHIAVDGPQRRADYTILNEHELH